MIYDVTIGEKNYRVEFTRVADSWSCKLDGREIALDFAPAQPGVFSILIEGRSYEVRQESSGGETSIVIGQQRFGVAVRDPRSLHSRRRPDAGAHGVKKITAPMPGKVVRILAPAGSEVEAGQSVLVIEAMKMQNELKSPKKGVIRKLTATEGMAVEAGQALAEVE
ncbi:MAG: acetyl-CoA carboxylase biotin carboxyl carrier protein subunit [Acidobacteriia bacterium]|nr:acetyl-CoA carboxylase biotin carboxyl carrier protein subunit [Terriglobia bacterium]